jgi:hypothetical protein
MISKRDLIFNSMYSLVFSLSNILYTELIILTLIMGVVNSTMKDGTLSSDGQNE